MALKPISFQESATNVRDWDVIAAHIAQGLEDRGLLPGPDAQPPASAWAPVKGDCLDNRPAEPSSRRPLYYIHAVSPDSPFLLEVHDALQKEIEQRGGIIAGSPDGATRIHLEVRLIRWGSVPTGVGRYQTWLEQTLTPNMRTEAVWQATICAIRWDAEGCPSPGDTVLLTLRKPFYVFASDLPLYDSAPGLSGANTPLRYAR